MRHKYAFDFGHYVYAMLANAHRELIKLKIKYMSKEDLIAMRDSLKVSLMKSWEIFLKLDRAIESLPNGEASSVSENEQEKEVCKCGSFKVKTTNGYECINEKCGL